MPSASKEHPTPWTFEWDLVPKVYDADGRTVAVLSTWTIAGAYDTGDISETGRVIAAAPELLAGRIMTTTRKCWFNPKRGWLPGTWHQWGQDTDDGDSFPAAIIEDNQGRVHVVYAKYVTFGEEKPEEAES